MIEKSDDVDQITWRGIKIEKHKKGINPLWNWKIAMIVHAKNYSINRTFINAVIHLLNPWNDDLPSNGFTKIASKKRLKVNTTVGDLQSFTLIFILARVKSSICLFLCLHLIMQFYCCCEIEEITLLLKQCFVQSNIPRESSSSSNITFLV